LTIRMLTIFVVVLARMIIILMLFALEPPPFRQCVGFLEAGRPFVLLLW
jgi:hypothetical protein